MSRPPASIALPPASRTASAASSCRTVPSVCTDWFVHVVQHLTVRGFDVFEVVISVLVDHADLSVQLSGL